VSGSLLRRLAAAAGVRCVTTLTGFKWIARAGGDEGALVYGYEQALGYAVRPDLVADKDGISAALLVLQVAAGLARHGRTLLDRLDDLTLAHGVHVTRQRSLRAAGPSGLARLADAVARVRKDPPRLLAGQPVTVTDLREPGSGLVDLAGGRAERSPGQPIPPADVLIWQVGDRSGGWPGTGADDKADRGAGAVPDGRPGAGARVMIRPSGTEPELKIYAEAVCPVRSRGELPVARANAAGRVDELLSASAALLAPDALPRCVLAPWHPRTTGFRPRGTQDPNIPAPRHPGVTLSSPRHPGLEYSSLVAPADSWIPVGFRPCGTPGQNNRTRTTAAPRHPAATGIAAGPRSLRFVDRVALESAGVRTSRQGVQPCLKNTP
jgi:hypothetical protein